MPKKCENCDFFHPENTLNECPECGRPLQFTMFTPPGFQAEEGQEKTRGKSEWDDRGAAHELIELPLSVRMSQIVAGTGIYCTISRTLKMIFCSICFVGNTNLQLDRMVIAYWSITAAFHILGALVGGAVAGAWSVNWIPQGIGVGVGVFLSPLIMYCIFGAVGGTSVLGYLMIICVTTLVSVFGAFVGHKLVAPTRYVIS